MSGANNDFLVGHGGRACIERDRKQQQKQGVAKKIVRSRGSFECRGKPYRIQALSYAISDFCRKSRHPLVERFGFSPAMNAAL
jgi:hypothetical protein